MTRRAGMVALVALVAVGCSLAGPNDPVVSVPPATATSQSSGPSPSGTAAAARELPSSGPLEAGTYTRAAFEPGITFALDDGWSVGSVADGFFDVQQRSATPDVVAVQFGRVGSVIGEGGTAARPASAEDAATRIAANPGLETLEQSESRLGGQTGVVIEVENAGEEHAPILDVPAGRLGIDPGRRLWIALFDTADGPLAVMVGGPTGGWEAALRIAEPVLESIVIDG